MNNQSNPKGRVNQTKYRIFRLLTMFFILLLVFVGMATAQEAKEIPTEPLNFNFKKVDAQSVDYKFSDDFNLYLGTVSMNNASELNRKRIVWDRLNTVRPFHLGHSPKFSINLRRATKGDEGIKDY